MQLRFEAAVGGVVPAIRVISETLAAAHIERVHGIVNGTTNFILTAMERTGASYEDALAEAQRLGYAESDPTEDVTGADAAAKMAIIARLAFGAPVHIDDVPHEGIEHITPDDIAYARELDLSLKLIGSAERVDGGLSVQVYPAFLFADHPLAAVNGSFNAVTIESPAITEITLSGPGAGGSQTASAVLGDVISAMIPPPFNPPPAEPVHAGDRPRVGLLPARRGGRHPRRAGPGGRDPGPAGRVDPVGGPEGHRRGRAAGDGHAPGPGVQVPRRGGDDRPAGLRALAPAGDQGHRRDVRMSPATNRFRGYSARKDRIDERRGRRGGHSPFGYPAAVAPSPQESPTAEQRGPAMSLWRYADRLPVEPLVTLEEGDTPLVQAPHLSELTGCDVWLKVEGANPTGSFKDRGMTVAVSAAIGEGAEAVVCASTGNTAASAGGVRRRARACAGR